MQVGTITSTNYGSPGQGGYLGRPYDPFIVEQDPNSASFKVNAFSSPLAGNRMDHRKGLLNALDTFHAWTDQQQEFACTYDEFQERALGMITSPKAKEAFDLTKEPEKVRDTYGRNRAGQGLLLARRLVESWVRFVTVKGYVGPGWDHHPEIFPRLRTEVPPYDQGYAALLNDLR